MKKKNMCFDYWILHNPGHGWSPNTVPSTQRESRSGYKSMDTNPGPDLKD